MLHQLDTLDKVQQFIINKRSNFIVKNCYSGHQITFKVKLKEEKNNKKIYFVYLEYIRRYYIGVITTENVLSDGLEITNKYFSLSEKLQKETKEVWGKGEIFQKLFKFVIIDKTLPRNIEFYHVGLCCKCGKKLTKLKYIELGIGQKCLESEG